MNDTTGRDLRVLICDDEFLLAMDMAQQFEALQAEVVGTARSIGELRTKVAEDDFDADLVVLDLQYVDGMAYDIIPLIEDTGASVVICSGYNVEERPPEFSHVPWVNKPATAEGVVEAVRAQSKTRGDDKSV